MEAVKMNVIMKTGLINVSASRTRFASETTSTAKTTSEAESQLVEKGFEVLALMLWGYVSPQVWALHPGVEMRIGYG